MAAKLPMDLSWVHLCLVRFAPAQLIHRERKTICPAALTVGRKTVGVWGFLVRNSVELRSFNSEVEVVSPNHFGKLNANIIT